MVCFVMIKKREQPGVLHLDTVGIQTDVIPELIGCLEKFIVQGKHQFMTAFIFYADLKCDLLKTFLLTAFIFHG